MTPPASVEPVRVFRYKHRNMPIRGEDPTPPVTTLFMAYDPLPGTSYSGDDGRWLPVDAYNALLARANTATFAADLMRARAERAERFLSMLFESHWDGTIGRPPTWHLRGDFRHILAGLRGETLDDAIAALRAGGG